MGMVKLILPGSYNFGESASQIIKIAAAGLRGNDLHAFIKRAGHKLADAMQKMSFAPGEVPIHLIAIGATEFYGPNRNGDGFTEACCQQYHDTFVKHARWYRNHQNKDPKKSYGVIKHSSYNDTMHRLELIVALNGTKEAARRNGGLVADNELQKLASGSEDWGVSMACKVAYDVCSGCGNRARTKDDYCTEKTCKYGGAKNNLCKVAEDGHILYVDNPHPTWFDISDVFRPADRIAYVLGPMQKAASGRVVGGAELASDLRVSAPFELAFTNISDRKLRVQLKLAHSLAAIENELATGMTKWASMPPTRTYVRGTDGLARSPKCGMMLKAMAHEKLSMSLKDFILFTTVPCTDKRAGELAAAIQPHLPGIFSRMCDDTEKLAEDLRKNPFRPSDCEPTNEWKKWALEKAADGSLALNHVQYRAFRDAIHEEQPRNLMTSKSGIDYSSAQENVARAYGLYKLAFLYEIMDQDPDFELTSDLVVRQNYIS